MTATNNGLAFDRNKFFGLVKHILIPLWWPGEGIVKFEHGPEVLGESHRDALTNRKITNKAFFNQSTLVVRRRIGPAAFKEVNIKLFGNGSVQMTGINSEQFARETLEWLISECAKLPESPFTKPPQVNKMNIQMINSDFSLGTQLHNEVIHQILRDNYNLFSTFEKTLYQGVDTKYYYNTAKPATAAPGICHCEQLCNGQGLGNAPGQCKRITISIFQTGNIIITGARHMDQIHEAYDFINRVFDAHEKEIVLPPAPPAAAEVAAAVAVTVAPKRRIKRTVATAI